MVALQTYIYQGRVLHLNAYEGPLTEAEASTDASSGSADRAASPSRIEFEGLQIREQDGVLTVTSRVSGSELAYLYVEVLLKDSGRERFYGPVMREYIRSRSNEGSSGITRPVWGDSVAIEVKVRPQMRLITDGVRLAFCYASPEGYSSPGYRLGGLYMATGEPDRLRALLGFGSEGGLKRVTAVPEQDRRAGARVVTPTAGDRVVPFAQVFTPSSSDGKWETGLALADTLTLGARSLRVINEKPLPGVYLVGIVAHDQNGRFVRKYVRTRLGE